ncbi:antitoxin [soil metagenome]
MGLFDKAKDLLSDNKEQVKDGIDKVADIADDQTGSKHSDKIDTAGDKAKDAIDKLDGK